MRGGLHTPTCCPKKAPVLASRDAGRPEHTYLLPQKGACSHSFLLVLRPPLRLPGFKCVQPGLEALARPPQYAGEVRVVEGNHLRAVAPPRGPLRSCEVVRGKARVRSSFMSGRLCCLASTESNSCMSSVTSALAISVFTRLSDKSVKLVLQTTSPVLPAITRQPGFVWSRTAAWRGSSS